MGCPLILLFACPVSLGSVQNWGWVSAGVASGEDLGSGCRSPSSWQWGAGGAGFLHGASWLHTDREHICCLCNPWLFTGRDKEGSHTKDVPTVAMTVPSPSSLPSANSPKSSCTSGTAAKVAAFSGPGSHTRLWSPSQLHTSVISHWGFRPPSPCACTHACAHTCSHTHTCTPLVQGPLREYLPPGATS